MTKFAAPLFLFVLAACAAQAQRLKLPASFDTLAAKATEVADVNLDAAMLAKAAGATSAKESASVQQGPFDKIKGGFVRSYKFAREGEYDQADVEAVRSQLRGSGWACIVNVRDNRKGESAQVCFHASDGKPDGLAVVAAEPKQLTIVNIVGTGDLAQLDAVEKEFHVADMSFTNQR
jgi:hypothetical protein